jgi:hypothetical protein
MENRERDRVSQRNAPTETGQSNRRTEEEKEREHNSGKGAEFGKTSGRPENLEGGNMNDNKRNDKKKDVTDKSMNDEPSRRSSGSDFSSTGRPGSIDNIDRSDLDRNSELESDVSSGGRGSKGEFGNTGVKESSGKMGNSTEGRH